MIPDLQKASALFGVNAAALAKALTSRTVKDTSKGGQDVLTPLNVDQAVYSRDALAKSTYDRLFSWVVKKINDNIFSKSSNKRAVIGVLDIYGFEILAVRRRSRRLASSLTPFAPCRKTRLSSSASTIATKSCSRCSSS